MITNKNALKNIFFTSRFLVSFLFRACWVKIPYLLWPVLLSPFIHVHSDFGIVISLSHEIKDICLCVLIIIVKNRLLLPFFLYQCLFVRISLAGQFTDILFL